MSESGYATVSAAVRASYLKRPHDLRLEDLARISGIPAGPHVHKMLFRRWAATPQNMARLRLLAEALGVPRGVPLFADVPDEPGAKRK